MPSLRFDMLAPGAAAHEPDLTSHLGRDAGAAAVDPSILLCEVVIMRRGESG